MNNVNKTLYIPLYGKAYVSRRGMILRDPKAEEIWAAEGFALKGRSRSKWLAYYMGIRAAVFDRWLRERMAADPGAVVLHIGCGLDSRVDRVGTGDHSWFDVDFPEVIRQRRRFWKESEDYRMLSADVRESGWLAGVPGENAIVVMEGVSMYLAPGELNRVLAVLSGHFEEVSLLMDCYSVFAAKASRVKNPVNDVGVSRVYGLDEPRALNGSGLVFRRELEMTPEDMIARLQGMERRVFRGLYAGRTAKKLYKLYEFGKN